MPLWSLVVQIIIGLGLCYIAFVGAGMGYFSLALSGWSRDTFRCLGIMLVALAAVLFLIYHPTFVWDVLQLIPRPPEVEISGGG